VLPEGRIDITVKWGEGRCHGVEVRSHRPLGVWQALVGKPVDEALALAPLLSSICSGAHGLAAVRACESALGIQVEPQQDRLRELLVGVEALENHLWFWLLTAPPLLGLPPRASELKAARQCLAALRAATGAGSRWARLGGVEASVSSAKVETASSALRALGVPMSAPSSMSGLRGQGGVVGQLFDGLLQQGLERVGVSTTALMADLDVHTVANELQRSADFARAPVIDSSPRECGPLASSRGHPLVKDAETQFGRGLAARLCARWVETCATMAAIVEGLNDLGDLRPVNESRRSSGHGAASARTSRGPLLHAVTLEQGRVVSWNAVAPTEWTFHPRGAVHEALLGLTAGDPRVLASWVIASFDPCVSCEARVEQG